MIYAERWVADIESKVSFLRDAPHAIQARWERYRECGLGTPLSVGL